MSILATMPPKASSASSPCSAARPREVLRCTARSDSYVCRACDRPRRPRRRTPANVAGLRTSHTRPDRRPPILRRREMSERSSRSDSCACSRTLTLAASYGCTAQRRQIRHSDAYAGCACSRDELRAGCPSSCERPNVACTPSRLATVLTRVSPAHGSRARHGAACKSQPSATSATSAVRRTPGISCEAVPASMPSRRGHEAAPRPCCAARCRRKLRQLHPLVRRHVRSAHVRLPFSRTKPTRTPEHATPLENSATNSARLEEPHSTWPRHCAHARDARAGAAPATTASDVTPRGPIRPFPVRQPGA